MMSITISVPPATIAEHLEAHFTPLSTRWRGERVGVKGAFHRLPTIDRCKALDSHLERRGPVAVLFSGGLDSSLLLAVAAKVLGSGVTAITFTGPHTAPGELAVAWSLARRLQVRHLVRAFDPLSVGEFRHNTLKRCYACKKAIITEAWKIATALGVKELWDGTNLDDLADFRPGHQAVLELGVESPLLLAGMGKAAIRALSRDLGLDAARPSQSCLATRFPYDTDLTIDDLARVGRGEAWLRRRGFSKVRLRVRENGARLELAPEEWPAFLAPEVRRSFTAFAMGLGFKEVFLDMPGSF